MTSEAKMEKMRAMQNCVPPVSKEQEMSWQIERLQDRANDTEKLLRALVGFCLVLAVGVVVLWFRSYM